MGRYVTETVLTKQGDCFLLSGEGGKMEMDLQRLPYRLFLFPKALEPVPDKGAGHKDDHVDDDDDENIKYPEETRTEAQTPKNEDIRYEHKGNAQDETGYCPVPEDPHKVLLPAMKKPKSDAYDKIQQVKPDGIVHEYQQYLVSYLKMFRKNWISVFIYTIR